MVVSNGESLCTGEVDKYSLGVDLGLTFSAFFNFIFAFILVS